MPEEKAFFAGLFDLAFEGSLTKKIVRLLYIIFLLGGGVTVVALVVMGFQESPAQGLVYLVSGVVGLFLWILLTRLGLELVLIVLRIADNIERATRSGN
ncbi:MAG: hypothetical protein AUH88_00415 [Acidobacteria bacterium 13_1_40CM_4_61_5]|nr:MAG: hypothetical protein AUH88_00415 [Acidobacteria bacterium 13_1_40CM_4_61_5]